MNKLKVLLFLVTAVFLYFCWGGDPGSGQVQTGPLLPLDISVQDREQVPAVR